MDHHEPSRDLPDQGSAGPRGFKWVLGGFVLVAAFFLITEHRAHVFGVLPYLLLAACPLMHVFMHRGHGGHGAHRHSGEPDRKER